MKATLLLALVLLCSPVQGQKNDIREEIPQTSVSMKKFTVDLDMPPEERWLSILPIYNSSVPLIIDYFNKEGPKIRMDALAKLMSNVKGYFGEYGLEMESIAKFLGIDVGIIITLNLSYELRRLGGPRINTTGNVTSHQNTFQSGIACTSILALNKSGNVIHGRNLDWELPVALRNLSIQVDFLKGGEVAFSGEVVVGTVGVSTGISKKGGFSLSINERSLGGKIFENGVNAALQDSKCPTFWAREVLSSANSYPEAVEMLQKEQLIAPVYYIIAGSGPSEGAVITRDRNKCLDLWLLNSNDNSTGREGIEPWYILETNYDRWNEPEPYDNRRGYGIQYMNEMGQDKAASADGMLSVLAKWPMRNNYTSTYALMLPGNFHAEFYILYP